MSRIRNRTLPAGLALVTLGVLLAGDGRAEQSQQPAQTPQPKGATSAAAGAKVAPKLEPKAIELLQAMSQRLAAAHAMTFTALSTEEGPTRLGPPLAYTTLSEVTLQRPDKLRVITAGDGPASEFYYGATSANGTTAYGGYDHYYGGSYTTYHPPTVVNHYCGSGCYDCGGWNTAGAAPPWVSPPALPSARPAPARPARMPTPRAPQPAAGTPWGRSIRACRPAACTDPSSASTNAVARGSRRPTGRTGSTIGSCPAPEVFFAAVCV
jgi:hypothetical protein